MRTTTVICDNCQRDLTTTGNCIDYRIALVNESIPFEGSWYVTVAMVRPPLERDAHFCGVGCLVIWVQQKLVKQIAAAAEP